MSIKIGQLIKDGEANISISLIADTATMFISESSKLIKLIKSDSYANDVLYTSADAYRYKAILGKYKSVSVNTTWNTILAGVIDDIDNNAGKKVSDILMYMN